MIKSWIYCTRTSRYSSKHRAIEVYKDQRKEGIAGSALRQLPTYVRKHFKEIRSIGITLFGKIMNLSHYVLVAALLRQINQMT